MDTIEAMFPFRKQSTWFQILSTLRELDYQRLDHPLGPVELDNCAFLEERAQYRISNRIDDKHTMLHEAVLCDKRSIPAFE